MLLFLLQAAGNTPQPTQGGAGQFMGMFVPIIAIIGVMYFFMIRPQNRRAKEEMSFRESLKKGDRVITTAGIYGRVDSIEEHAILIEVDNGVKIKFLKEAIRPLPDAGDGK